MSTILITGATGNIGMEVIKCLNKRTHSHEIYAGSRNLDRDKQTLKDITTRVIQFDFTDIRSYEPALNNCNILFLLRPPQIADVDKYFKPLIETAKRTGVEHIVFLSVQGVENSTIIPHHKIEKLIDDSKIPYTFLRPAYFMQNFTTTLQPELANKKMIFLPAGKAKFVLIDVRDIGAVAAIILENCDHHINKIYELTSDQKLSFEEMADKLSMGLGIKIQYKSPNLLHFYLSKKKESMPTIFILVMIMLHYFPRFQKVPAISDRVEKITGSKPITFEQFIQDNKNELLQADKYIKPAK